MIITPEDQRMANNGTHDHDDRHDHDDQQKVVDALDLMDEQDGATTPAEKETVEGNTDDELAADEKIRQREELLEEKAV